MFEASHIFVGWVGTQLGQRQRLRWTDLVLGSFKYARALTPSPSPSPSRPLPRWVGSAGAADVDFPDDKGV